MHPEEHVAVVVVLVVGGGRGRRLAVRPLQLPLLADLGGQLEAVGFRWLEVQLAEPQILREGVRGGPELRGDARRQQRDHGRLVDAAAGKHYVLLRQRLALEREEEMHLVRDDRAALGDAELPAGCRRLRLA